MITLHCFAQLFTNESGNQSLKKKKTSPGRHFDITCERVDRQRGGHEVPPPSWSIIQIQTVDFERLNLNLVVEVVHRHDDGIGEKVGTDRFLV